MGSNSKIKMLTEEELKALPLHRLSAYYQKLTKVGPNLKVGFDWLKCLRLAHKILAERSYPVIIADIHTGADQIRGQRSLRHKVKE